MLRASGIGTYLEELLPRIVASWSDAHFTILGDPAALEASVGGPRVEIRALHTPIYSPLEAFALSRAIPRQTDLMWSPHYNVPLVHPGRLAVTIHDLNHLAIRQDSLPRRAYARIMHGAVRRRASVVLCVSHFTANELRRHLGAMSDVHVVPLGVAPRWFTVPEARPAALPYFLCVGNVKPHKNLGRLISAFGRVADRIPHRLVIVGRREGLRTIDHAVSAASGALGDRVVFTGFLERSALEERVAGCDALLIPSLYEGFGLPALEALACGRALGVSRAASLPEVCGPHAEYFDPLDVEGIARALVRLAERPPDDANLRTARRAWARTFDWDHTARKTLELLRSAVNRG